LNISIGGQESDCNDGQESSDSHGKADTLGGGSSSSSSVDRFFVSPIGSVQDLTISIGGQESDCNDGQESSDSHGMADTLGGGSSSSSSVDRFFVSPICSVQDSAISVAGAELDCKAGPESSISHGKADTLSCGSGSSSSNNRFFVSPICSVQDSAISVGGAELDCNAGLESSISHGKTDTLGGGSDSSSSVNSSNFAAHISLVYIVFSIL
jgi:hypothetical protein